MAMRSPEVRCPSTASTCPEARASDFPSRRLQGSRYESRFGLRKAEGWKEGFKERLGCRSPRARGFQVRQRFLFSQPNAQRDTGGNPRRERGAGRRGRTEQEGRRGTRCPSAWLQLCLVCPRWGGCRQFHRRGEGAARESTRRPASPGRCPWRAQTCLPDEATAPRPARPAPSLAPPPVDFFGGKGNTIRRLGKRKVGKCEPNFNHGFLVTLGGGPRK